MNKNCHTLELGQCSTFTCEYLLYVYVYTPMYTLTFDSEGGVYLCLGC